MSLITIETGSTRIETDNHALAHLVLEHTSEYPQATLEAAALVPQIGQPWPGQGGIYAGRARGEGGRDYHLIVSLPALGTHPEIAWGAAGEDEPGARSEWDGAANTRALAASSNKHPAATWAAELEIEGHTDWYLPGRRELALCYATVPELFEKKWHWSSTQYSPHDAWVQGFVGGYQYDAHKDYTCRARAVRRFLID